MAQIPANLTLETYLTSHEAAALTQFNPSSICKWVKEDRIPAFKTPGGHRRIKVADLVAFLRKHEMPVPVQLSALEVSSATNAADLDEVPKSNGKRSGKKK